MAVDHAALKTALEIEPRYDALVRAGSNGLITQLVNVEDAALDKRWRAISMADFLDITAGESFTSQQEERMRTYIAAEGQMRLDKKGVRSWVFANVSLPKTITGLTVAGQVVGRLGDAFTDEGSNVSLRHVRIAVAQISKSLISANERKDKGQN